MSEYPEHDKMQAMRPELDAVADFLERLYDGEIKYSGMRLYLAYSFPDDPSGRLNPAEPSISDLLAQWSGIDQNKIEKEKRRMLERIRNDST